MAITFNFTAAMGAYKEATIADTTETTMLDDQQVVGNQRGLAGYVYSDKAGTIKIYFIDRNNADIQLQSKAVVASQLTVLDFDYHLPRYKATFTRDDAVGDATVWVEFFSYGASR